MKKLIKNLLLSVGLCVGLVTTTYANDPPKAPFKIIVAVPAGSGPDKVVREYAEELSALWKVQVNVDNRPGGNGIVAVNAHQADKENSIVLITIDNYLSYPYLTKNTAVIDRLLPLSFDGLSELVLFSSPKYENFTQLQDAIKKKSTFGSWSVGSPPQLAGLELSSSLGAVPVHTPYVQYSNWFVDVAAQHITFSFATFVDKSIDVEPSTETIVSLI